MSRSLVGEHGGVVSDTVKPMGEERDTFRKLEAANRHRTVELVAVFVLIYAVCGGGLDITFHTVRVVNHRLTGIPSLMLAAIVIASMQAIWAYYWGSSTVIAAVQGDDLTPTSVKEQAVVDVVGEMALAARMPVPRVCVMEDPEPNAFACGRDLEHSVICVTRGLIDQLDREELQGVIAHEVAHIRGHDTRVTQMAVVMVGGFALLSGFGLRMASAIREMAIPFVGLLLVPIFILGGIGWVFSKMVAIALSRQREYLADAAAVEFTRNPQGLIRALGHIAKIESPLKASLRGVAPLFIVDPLECGGGGWTDYLDEVARIEAQQDKSKEQRDAEAAAYVVKGMTQVSFQVGLSSHPPIRDRLARLRGLLHEGSGESGEFASELPAEIAAKRKAAARVVTETTQDNPEVAAAMVASMIQANPLAQMISRLAPDLPAGGPSSASTEGQTYTDPNEEATYQKLYEYNLGRTGNKARLAGGHAPNLGSPLEALAAVGKMDPTQLQATLTAAFAAAQKKNVREESVGVAASAAGEGQPSRKLRYMFWIVIALSAGAILASLAIK
jgi:heat shock protein HtpX